MEKDKLDCFTILLNDLRIDLNAPDTTRKTLYPPLTYSIAYNKKSYFDALLSSSRANEIKLNTCQGNPRTSALYWAWQRSDLSYVQKLLRQPGITVVGPNMSGLLSDLLRANLQDSRESNPNLKEDLEFLDQAIARGNPDPGKFKRRLGIFLAVATFLIYTPAVIGIPLGFTRKPQETYEAFEKLHLHGFIDNLSESTMAQVMTGMIGGVLLIALLVTAGILIKNNPAPPKVQNPRENKIIFKV